MIGRCSYKKYKQGFTIGACLYFILSFSFVSFSQSNIISTIAGCDTAGFSGDGGLAINAKFHFPSSIYLDNSNGLLIADAFNHRIRRINLNTGIVTTVIGNGTGGYTGDNIPGAEAELYVPDAVCVDAENNIYIADGLNNRIRKVDVSTGLIFTVAGNGTGGVLGDGGLATDAEINIPTGIFADHSGNIFFADNANNKIRRIDNSTHIISTIAGTGAANYSGDGGLAVNAELNGPGQVFIDNVGDVFFSDTWNNVVRKIDHSTGIVTTVAGTGGGGYSGDGGLATDAELFQPYGVIKDNSNHLLISEFKNGVIRCVNLSTNIISTLVGTGVQGYSGDGGLAIHAQVVPDDMRLDAAGNMYIADYGNHCIRRISSAVVTNDIEKAERFIAYPNPNKTGIFHLDCPAIYGVASAYVFNAAGSLVFSSPINGSMEINLSSQPAGVYIIQLQGQSINTQQKVTIIR